MTEHLLRVKPEECRNYLADLFFEADEGADRFIARTGASLCKAYRNGVLWFHVHFATNAAQYCSVFKRSPGAKFHWADNHDTGRNRKEQRRTSDANRGLGQGIVLVKVAEFVEKPKRMAPTEIPSMVWLRPLDECLLVRRIMSDEFSPTIALDVGGLSVPTSFPEENRKLRSAGALCEAEGQLSNSDVEYRSKQYGNQANLDIPLWIGGGLPTTSRMTLCDPFGSFSRRTVLNLDVMHPSIRERNSAILSLATWSLRMGPYRGCFGDGSSGSGVVSCSATNLARRPFFVVVIQFFRLGYEIQ